jgi:TolB-like protein/Tfp pilus assembly protein PilF
MATRRFYGFGPFRLDPTGRVLFRGKRLLPLQPKAADTLLLLVENAGNVVTKEQILQTVWRDTFVEEGSLTRTISVLRKLLGRSARGREHILTVPKRGYSFAVPVDERAEDAAAASGGRVMLCVLPFDDLSEGRRQRYFGDGLTEEMIGELGKLSPERLGVIARTSAMQYRGTRKTVRQIGRELGVAYVLEGSVRRSGGRVRVSAQLVDTRDQTPRWTGSYDRPSRDVLVLQRELARAIAQGIELTLAPRERARLAAATPLDPAAFEEYLKGRYLWNSRTHDGLERSLRCFRAAIAREPGYAAAHSGLADVQLTLLDFDRVHPRKAITKAKVAASAALAIDESLAEAHVSLAHAHFHELAWAAAERGFRRGLASNPSYATAHLYYANLLLTTGRVAEAIEEAGLARALDPVSLPALANAAMIFCLAGQTGRAIEIARKALQANPAYAPAHEDLGRAYLRDGRHGRAVEAFEQAVALTNRRSPRYLASLAHGYGVAGQERRALALIRALELRRRRQYVSAFGVALAYAGLGEDAQALAWLARARRELASAVPFLAVEPRLALLRGDARFQELLRDIKVAPPPGRAASGTAEAVY